VGSQVSALAFLVLASLVAQSHFTQAIASLQSTAYVKPAAKGQTAPPQNGYLSQSTALKKTSPDSRLLTPRS